MSAYQLIILTGPSGVGKSSLGNALLDSVPVARCVTCTTRKPREGEVDGIDYYFLLAEEFEQQMQEGAFIEHSFHYGHWYGVRLRDIEKVLQASHAMITLNWQGAQVLSEKIKTSMVIYVEPPSMSALEERLGNRGCQARFEYAEEDLKHAKSFEHRLVNDDFVTSFKQLQAMVEGFLLEKAS